MAPSVGFVCQRREQTVEAMCNSSLVASSLKELRGKLEELVSKACGEGMNSLS